MIKILPRHKSRSPQIAHGASARQVESRLAPWLYVICVLLFITPDFILPAVGARRADEFLLLGLLGLLAYLYAQRIPFRVAWGLGQTLMLGYCGVVLTSMLTGALMGYNASTTDVFQFIRVAKYLLIYTLTVTVVADTGNPDAQRARILKAIMLGSLLLFPVILQQYFDLFGLNNLYVEYISKGTQSSALIDVDYDRRALGFIGNPNALGFLYVIPAIVTLHFMLSAPRFKLRYLGLFALQVTAILMTLSRTSLLALTAATLYLLVTLPASPLAYGKLRQQALGRGFMLLFVLTAAGALVVSNQVIYDDILWRFALLQDVADDYSWQGRLVAWQENWGLFVQSPLLGVGPLFATEFQYSSDNEWLELLRFHGLLGTLYVVAMFAAPHFLSMRKGGSVALMDTRRLIEAVLLATALYMLPAAVFQHLVLMPLVIIIFALGDSTVRVYNVLKQA